MAGSINKYRIKAESTGFDKAVKDINKVGQAQERTTRSTQNLGKASAASGRQFSAQASGLGGFVAAYAGAAANIFAVQQAFSALSRAAQVETTIQGTRTLAAEIGLSGDAIISKLQEVTQSQLTAAEAAQNANIALSAGFSPDQIEKLTEVATKASKALGRNLTESIQRVFRGAIKLEPELLDEIGIFTRIEPAVEKYAASLNRSVGSLTEFERRQAFANAVAEEGQRKFNEIDLTGQSAQKSLERLATQFIDLATKVGISLANFISPFVDFLSKDFGNTLLVLGGIFTLVFKNAGAQVAAFTTKASAGLATALGGLEKYAQKISGTTAQFRTAMQDAQSASEGFKGAGAFAGNREIASAATRAKQQLAGGEIRTIAQSREARAALEAQIASEKKFQLAVQSSTRAQDAKNKSLANSKMRVDALTTSVKALTAAENQSSATARVAGAASIFFQKTIRGVGAAISFTLGKLNLILFAITTLQTVFQLFGIDAIGAVVDWFGKLGKKQDMAKEGFAAIVSVVSDVNKEMLKLAKVSQPQYLEKITKQLEQIQRINSSGNRATGSRPGKQATEAEALIEARKRLSEANKNFQKAIGGDAKEFAKAQIDYNVAKDVVAILEQGYQKLSYEIQRSSKETGLSTKVTAAAVVQLKEQGALITQGTDAITLFGQTVGKVNKNGVTVFDDFGQKILDTEVTISALKKTYSDSFKAGTITADKASKTLIGLRNQLAKLEKAQKAAGDQGDKFDASIARVTAEIEEQSKAVQFLKKEEQDLKTFRETFAKEIRSVDNAIQSGVLGIDGSLARDATEQQANRVKLLDQTLSRYNTLLEDMETEEYEEGAILNLKKQGIAALKAQEGIVMNFPANLRKLRIEEEKRLTTFNNQLTTLRLQRELQDIKIIEANLKLNKENLRIDELRLSNRQLTQELATVINNNDLQALKQAKELNQIEKERVALKARSAAGELESTRIDQEYTEQEKLFRARVAVEEAATNTSAEQFRARKNLLEVEKEIALNTLKRQQDQLKLEYNQKQQDLLASADLLEAEREIIKQKALNEMNANWAAAANLKAQRDIEDQKRAIELKLLNTQKETLAVEEKMAIAKIKADQDSQLKEIDLLESKYELIEYERKITQKFLEENAKQLNFRRDIAVAELKAQERDDLASKLSKSELGILKLEVENATGIEKHLSDARKKVTEIAATQLDNLINQNANEQAILNQKIANHNKETELLTKRREIEDKIRQAQQKGNQGEYDAEIDRLTKKLANINLEIAGEKQAHDNKMKSLDNEISLEGMRAENRQKNLVKEFDSMNSLADSLQSKVGGTLTNSVNDFFNAINEGTLTMSSFKDGVKNLFVNVLRDIQQTIIDELVNKPIQDALKGFVNNTVKPFLSNLGKSEQKGLVASDWLSEDEMGSPSPLGQKNDSPINSIGESLNSGVAGIMENVKGTTIAAFSGVLAATGDFKKAIIAAFIEMFARIMIERIAASFAAGGGLINKYGSGAIGRFARGGPVNTLRDRVPALLEPGEFVIRKPAAKAIGGSALNQLNATGKMNSSPGAVTVNVQNNGTPQQVEKSEVRNDMGQLFIDLVVKDIENNGKVRKAMRRG